MDEKGESYSYFDDLMSVVYPEVGVHAWLTGSWRVTTYGRYLVTSRGRDNDQWLVGLQVTYFARSPSEY